MTKQLFEEALADVKKVKQVAEDNAKRAVLDAVVPRIRDFIDRALLQEHATDINDMPGMPGAQTGDEIELLTDEPGVDLGLPAPAAAITPPDAEGKITLDIDALCAGDTGGVPVPPPMFGEPVIEPIESGDDEFEISLESMAALKPLVRADVKKLINKIVERVGLLQKAGPTIRATRAYREQIVLMIERVEHIYDYVQEQLADSRGKSSYETVLEHSFTALNKLQESTIMPNKTKRNRVNEADLTLKLTGLPDEVEDMLDSVGVDLITGEDDEGDIEGGDVETGDQGGDEAGGDDLGFGDEQGSEDEDTQMENRRLSDDTIVEIDEKMLRREIARMRALREETKPAAWGDGPGGSEILQDFGGGRDEGDAVDQEITDLSPAKAARPLGESDDDQEEDLDESDDQEDLDEQDQDLDQAVHAPQDMAMCEMDDDLDQAIDGPAHGGDDSMPSDKQSRQPGQSAANVRAEGLKRLRFEKKLQERAKSRASALKKVVRGGRSAKQVNEARREYAVVAKRFNESLARSKKVSQLVVKATKKLQEARSNSGAARPVESQAERNLHKKLAESSLINAKLLFTNKLLQTEGLTARQKAQAIRQLDEVRTVREAKLVYVSVARSVNAPQKTLREATDRQVIGSASRATRPASTNLNEGVETERWAQLAGINKR